MLSQGLIVPCQAPEDSPLHGFLFMAAMAKAVEQGGAVSIRANGSEDIRTIKSVVGLPVIGLLSVGLSVGQNGDEIRVGGYGHLVDDAGSGYWIGHKGLKQTLRWADGNGKPSAQPLAVAIYEALGSSSWEDVVGFVYGGGRSAVVALAPAVTRAAYAGDSTAQDIIRPELARIAQVLRRRSGSACPVALASGITKAGPPLTDAFIRALPPETSAEIVAVDPVAAAARLALTYGRESATKGPC